MASINHPTLSKIKYYFTILFFASCLSCRSQDIKMGYMQIERLFGYTYADTTYILTDLNTNVNRPYILINWNVKIDTSRLVQTTLTNNGYLKKYYGTCTYPGPGNYMIRWQDSFRIGNINNIIQSNIQDIKLSTLLSIQTFGSLINTAPVLQNKNLTLSLQNDSVVFKPNFNDIDSDSLSYQLTPCFASSYYTPIGSAIDNNGNIYFHKDSIGIYAFSIIIKEWRKDDAGDYVNTQSSQLDLTMHITTDVSIPELNNSTYKIYPNPINSTLNIVDINNQLQNSIIQITDCLGKIIYSNTFTSQINISDFSSGMYFLSVQDNKKTVKIIKE